MKNNLYFDPIVQNTISECIKRIRGGENIEDARQEAYLAIADEQPLTVEDAVIVARKAIERFRYHIRRYEAHEKAYADLDRIDLEPLGDGNYMKIAHFGSAD